MRALYGIMVAYSVHTGLDSKLYDELIAKGHRPCDALDLGSRILIGLVPHPNDLQIEITKLQGNITELQKLITRLGNEYSKTNNNKV